MRYFEKLRPIAQLYIAGVVGTGGLVVARSLGELWSHPVGVEWFALAALTLLTGSFTVKIPSTNASLSISEAFVFASILMFGPSAGTITVVLECLVILFWMPPQGRPLHRVMFNLAAPAIAVWISGTLFFAFSHFLPSAQEVTPLRQLFPPLLGFTALYFMLNSWLVALAVGLDSGESAFSIWRENFTWVSVNYFSGASLAALLVTYARGLDLSALLVIVPLLVVSYLTFRTAMGRIEDSNAHLGQLNQLYLSTIETLAMAIDAKDQITHGHIRRVQTSATQLAMQIGIADKALIRAIEAAALLHDMGKLAIPEHILNKPGKLTAEEFERMKQHASIGADILSAISFPYPVVPIVRHHHENWNGTGYPDGLSRTQIPIGARILAVVDCFDALTSDRPYRRKLSDREAIAILLERRGTMYDPLVVDTFIRLRPNGPDIERPVGSAETLDPFAVSAAPILPEVNRNPSNTETQRPAIGELTVDKAIRSAFQRVEALMPHAMALLFISRPADDEIEAIFQLGLSQPHFEGLRISLGKGVSGWVAANRKAIVNSDPALDLGQVLSVEGKELSSCLSVPIVDSDNLEGVLAVYTNMPSAYGPKDQATLEGVAAAIGITLRRETRALTKSTVDSMSAVSSGRPTTVLLIVVVGLKEFELRHGSGSAENTVNRIEDLARESLRGDDLVIRYSHDELLVLLNGANAAAERLIDERLQEAIDASDPPLTGNAAGIRVVVTKAAGPEDGESLLDLVTCAESRVGGRSSRSLPFLVH